MQYDGSETSPEPERSAYGSDDEHVRAWLRWAEGTPGGWRARLAEKVAENPALAASAAAAAAESEQDPTRFEVPLRRANDPGVPPSESASRCCSAPVLLDPLTSTVVRGICTTCRCVVDHNGTAWEPARTAPGT